MADIWRIANPTGREYTFYSATHNSYTRIYYFLFDTICYKCKISQHCNFRSQSSYMHFKYSEYGETINELEAKSSVFNRKKEFCDYIKTQISLYSNNLETTPSLRWEALKAFLRGCVISFEAFRMKKNEARLDETDQQMNLQDRENTQTPNELIKLITLK